MPPSLAIAFLRWFCKLDYLPDIEGDLFQLYERRVAKKGKKQANLLFYKDVLLLFRPGIIRSFVLINTPNNMEIFKHNLLISLRNHLKYKSFFLINLLGLTSGLACVLFIYLWVNDEVSMDQYHTNKDRLYQYMENVDQGNGMITRITSAGPTAKALEEEYPEVEKGVTTTWIANYNLSWEDNNTKADGIYVGKNYFDLFSVEILEGDKDKLLADKNNIIISDELALRFFGDTRNVIGKMIELDRSTLFQVAGVFKKLPTTSSLQYDFITSFEFFWDENEWVHNWYNTAPRTYVLMKEGADIDAFNEKIHDLIREKTEGNASHRSPFISKFSDRYLYGKYENGQVAGGRIEYVKMFSTIAVFILLIACINFMNLSTARASRRLKEVGVKKTVGANKTMLVFQYLLDSFLLVLIAMLVAFIIVWLLLPSFNLIVDKNLSLIPDSQLIIGSLLVIFITSLLSGLYPAFYLSKFKPIQVLKGGMNPSTGEAWARKGLVTFQFTLSVVLIASVIVVYEQIAYTQTKNLGYSNENVLMLSVEGALSDSTRFHTFLSELSAKSYVKNAAGSNHNMTGHNGGTYGVNWPGKDPNDRTEFENMQITPNFIKTMDIELKEGRAFNPNSQAENDKIIFNEAAIAFMGLENPVGKTVELWGDEVEIVGVVKDFHFDSFHEAVKPIFLIPRDNYIRNIMVRIETGKLKEGIQGLSELHETFNPGVNLGYKFLDDQYQKLYEAENRVSILAGYFAAIAIIISCLGLFGLAAFTLERKSKEIGIRKILGSTITNLTVKLTNDLTKSVLISIIIGVPISYFMLNNWLQNFEYKIALEWWFFFAAGMLTFIIAILTVGFQALKASLFNPILLLKDD